LYVNGGRVIIAVSKKSNMTMEETLPDKVILKKLTREEKGRAWPFI
jgi:hypothetical protein